MAKPNSFLHIARPLGPATVGAPSSTSPMKVIIHPQAILSIIDHATRRNVEQERVIGTLLGTRLEDGSEVEIKNCFAVGHSEAQDQVEVDMEYQKSMLALHLRANPKEVLVGWYATSSELNTFSALIQNFYGSQGDGTYPHPAVHLTVSTDPSKELELQTYISAPIGVTPERSADSAAFIPVPYELRYNEADKSGLELISAAKNDENRVSGVISDIEALERGVEDVLQMLDRVSRYVEAVIEEEAPPSRALGQYLLNTLALAPKIDPATIEKDFHNHVQDVLSIAYLANTIRTQIELSNRLATATLTLGGFSEEGGQGNRDGQRDGENRRGGRGGGRGGRQGKGGRDNRDNADRGEKAE